MKRKTTMAKPKHDTEPDLDQMEFFEAVKLVEEKSGAEQEKLVNEAKRIIETANQLARYTGKSYVVINHEEQAKPPVKRAGRPPGATKKAETAKGPFKYNEALYCKLCDVKGHDGRAHKFHPNKFTADELAAAKPVEATA